jgi:hypothetical protein
MATQRLASNDREQRQIAVARGARCGGEDQQGESAFGIGEDLALQFRESDLWMQNAFVLLVFGKDLVTLPLLGELGVALEQGVTLCSCPTSRLGIRVRRSQVGGEPAREPVMILGQVGGGYRPRDRRDRVLAPVFVSHRHDHLRPGSGEAVGQPQAQAVTCAGHHRQPSRQVRYVDVPLTHFNLSLK